MVAISCAYPHAIIIALTLLLSPDTLWQFCPQGYYAQFVSVGLLAAAVYWMNGALMTALDFLPVLRRYKIQQHKIKTSTDWSKLIKNILCGQITGFGGCLLLIAVPVHRYWGMGPDFASPLPSHKEMFWHFIFFIWAQKLVFFYVHWAFHSRWLYPYHKQHHEFKTPIALAASYSHPLENFLAFCLPFALGPILLSAHGFTFWCWAICAVLGTQSHHSDFKFPWTFFDSQPEFHDFHHEVFSNNFGGGMFLDWWHGTDAAWQVRRTFYRSSGRVVVPSLREPKSHEE